MKKTIFILLVSFSINVKAQSPKEVNMGDFIKEMQQIKKEDRRLQLVWWVPTEYWEVAFSQLSNISPEVSDKIQESVKNYIIICVGDMIAEGTAGFSYKTKEEIKSDLTVIDSANRIYYPLPEGELSDEALQISDVLKPLLAKTLGQVGNGLSIFYFKIQDKNGLNIFNPRKKEIFKVNQGGKSFVWDLPFASLLPPKYCPTDNQIMNSKWEYCPFHGVKLNK